MTDDAAPEAVDVVELPPPADKAPRRRKPAKRPTTPRKRSTSTAGAPTRKRPTTGTTPKRQTKPTNDQRVTSSIQQGVALAALLVSLGNQRDGEIIAEAAPAIADRTMIVVRKYPAVYAFLTSTEKSTGWLQLAAVLGVGVGLPIAANHGAIGNMPPILLDMLDKLRVAAIADASPLDVVEPEVAVEVEPAAPADG